MDKMSKAKEFGSCPDMYRSLNTDELRELLQNDDKMEQILVLDEKVMSFPPSISFVLLCHFGLVSIEIDVRNRSGFIFCLRGD